MKLRWVAAGTLSLALLLLPAVAAGQAGDPSSVIDAYEAARNHGDWDAVLSVFADDAVVIDRTGGEHTGKDEIRRLMVIQMGGNRGRYAAITERRTIGSAVSWIEMVATPTSKFSYVVQAMVQDGRITRLAYAPAGSPVQLPVGVESGERLPAPVSLGVVLLVLVGTVVGLSLPARRAGNSLLQGSLLAGLRQWSEARHHTVV